MDRPTKLRVGAMTYGIKWDSPGVADTLFGECCFQKNMLSIDPDVAPSRMASTFIHEVAHAGWDAMGYGNDKESTYNHEAVATFNGLFWPMFWRDNPEALKWWLSLIES